MMTTMHPVTMATAAVRDTGSHSNEVGSSSSSNIGNIVVVSSNSTRYHTR